MSVWVIYEEVLKFILITGTTKTKVSKLLWNLINYETALEAKINLQTLGE